MQQGRKRIPLMFGSAIKLIFSMSLLFQKYICSLLEGRSKLVKESTVQETQAVSKHFTHRPTEENVQTRACHTMG